MKKLLLTLLAAVLFLPSLTHAASVASAEELYINDRVADDLYVSGGTLSVTKAVSGDLLAAGGRVEAPAGRHRHLGITLAGWRCSVNREHLLWGMVGLAALAAAVAAWYFEVLPLPP